MRNLLLLLTFTITLSAFSQKVTKKDTAKIYSMEAVDQKPEFLGGTEKFVSYVKKNFVEAGFQNGLLSKVSTVFIVEKDGSLSDIEVLNAPNDAVKEALTKIISTAPKWTAGQFKAKAVRVKTSVVMQEAKKVRKLEVAGPVVD